MGPDGIAFNLANLALCSFTFWCCLVGLLTCNQRLGVVQKGTVRSLWYVVLPNTRSYTEMLEDSEIASTRRVHVQDLQVANGPAPTLSSQH